ncbi:hypothetical protein CAPTEDRAFT_155395 [Capitella teleta]|uniref:Sulfatase N-terminal domain-containing protein n=1 Tax=Capitella teleta TaxID=283909 RepID=R7VB05_CAPTE|nr:hypothetical protein CAPTEDRAFT_155395 [Capitella teleta]|eukprot:ELU12890.1 hypothetical protein CAPTEDRAFT_155395 [Capitella teleta]
MKRMEPFYRILAIALFIHLPQTTAKRPNILIIVADDLGYGDVGCFGNSTIRTPNIDRLAREGVRLSHHIAPAALCTPSRAALMTGRYPARMGMVSNHVVRVNIFTSASSGLPSNEITIAELAKDHGYATGFVGKWHLGLHCLTRDFCHHPLKQGFDYFYGIPLTNLKDFGSEPNRAIDAKYPWVNQALAAGVITSSLFFFALWYLQVLSVRGFVIALICVSLPVYIFDWLFTNNKLINAILMRNYEVVEQPMVFTNLTQRLVNEGNAFMEQSVASERPFLLVMSWIQVHTVLYNSKKDFVGRSQHGEYGDNIEEMDWSVGEIINSLDHLGITNETFVYFTSDNGGHVEETGPGGSRHGGHNGVFRGGKGQGGSEGGIRVPTVARFPGRITPSSEVSSPTSFMDILPSLASLWGGQAPSDRLIDGRNMIPLLTGMNPNPIHDYLFHYCGNHIHAARYTDGSDVYKVHYFTYNWLPGSEGCAFMCDCSGSSVQSQNPPLLFNIATDPGERSPLDVTSSKHQRILSLIGAAVQEHRSSVEPVSSQYSISRLIPLPWLQPCCNFPKCMCRDTFWLSKE